MTPNDTRAGITSATAGCGFPILILFFGSQIDGLAGSACQAAASDLTALYQIMVLSGILFFCKFTTTYCIETAQRRQAGRYKIEYMKAIIRQDVGW